MSGCVGLWEVSGVGLYYKVQFIIFLKKHIKNHMSSIDFWEYLAAIDSHISPFCSA